MKLRAIRILVIGIVLLVVAPNPSSAFVAPSTTNGIHRIRNNNNEQQDAFTLVVSSKTSLCSTEKDDDANNAMMPYSDDQKMLFYALGTNLALQVGGQTGVTALLESEELDIVVDGFSETFRGTHTQQDIGQILVTFGPPLNQILQERSGEIRKAQEQTGEDYKQKYLEEHPDAIATDTGLVFHELKAGNEDGASPTMESTVNVHYHGKLVDGTVFDSSVDRGQQIDLPMNAVIKGLSEGLMRMKEGGKATFIIPSDLAYADAGSGEVIPPGATLHFEVELFKVIAPQPDPFGDDFELIELPDGTQLRVPKGVKARVIDEDSGNSNTEESS